MSKLTSEEWKKTWGKLEESEGAHKIWRKNITIDDIQKVLDEGGDVNDHFQGYPLRFAVDRARMELVDFLIKKGSCQEALSQGLQEIAQDIYLTDNPVYFKIMTRLLQEGADPNYDRWPISAFEQAVRWSQPDRPLLMQAVDILIEYGADVTPKVMEEFNRVYDHYKPDPRVKDKLTHPEKYRCEKLARDWVERHPNPTVEELLAPIKETGENVITRLVHAGPEILERSFPVEKWANLEAIPTLTKIFADVPKTKKFMETMKKLDDKLKTTYNMNHEKQIREQQKGLGTVAQQRKQGER